MKMLSTTLSAYRRGRPLPEVAAVIEGLNAKRMQACVSVLPAFSFGPAELEAEKRKHLGILPFLAVGGLSADLTIRLSRFGRHRDLRGCIEARDEIAAHCADHRAFLWVDMEQSSTVDLTLEAFDDIARRRDNVGVCLQTCLRRTERDLDWLLKDRRPVRLVKGGYRERAPIAFDTWHETTWAFGQLIRPLIERSRRPAIGTHDPRLIEEAKQALASRRSPQTSGGPPETGAESAALEFQFYLGAKPHLAEALAAEGHPVRITIPHGALVPYALHAWPSMDVSRQLQRALGLRTIR